MAWKNGYYYRNKRSGGKVVTEYVGGGLIGEFVAQADDERRQERQEKRHAWKAIVDAENATDALLDGLTEAVNAYAGALMLVSGYHLGGNRQWRKKRK